MPKSANLPPKKAVTLKDIAERCGVAKTTVTEALRNNTVGLAASTVERIRTVAQEMGYNPAYHENARRLAMRKTGETVINHLVAIFLPADFLQTTFYLGIFRGAVEALEKAGFGVCVGNIQLDDATEATISFLPVVSRGDIDGIILPNGMRGSERLQQQLRQNHGFANRPIVSVIDPSTTISSVMPDYRDGYYQAARHLLTLGHRHLLQTVFPYFDAPPAAPTHREEGARQALREFGLDPETHLHRLPFTPAWVNPLNARMDIPADQEQDTGGYDCEVPLIDYLRAHPEVTAILTLNDAYALHVWYTLHRAGYRVPEDISLVGFDDTDPMRDARGRNILTTVRIPLYEIGQRAVGQLLREMRDRDGGIETVVLPTELIVRGSTGPAR